MNKVRTLIVGLAIASLLVVGVVAVAGSGFGSSTSWEPQQAATGDCDLHARDTDGDGILNLEDADWVRPMDGSGYGEGKGYRQSISEHRPMDGSVYGARQGDGQGQRAGGGDCDGSCL